MARSAKAKDAGRQAEDDARLKRYQAKRDFGRSGEPTGAAVVGDDTSDGAARFVIQEHDASRLHWDLRLERDGVLVCWALPKGLPEAPNENHFAAATEEHPLEYLDFEGQIPKGEYGAGTMKVWDRGTYECLKWEPRKVEVALHGQRVDARYALFAIAQGERPKDWMIHRMDAPTDAAREPMPQRLQPMLATLGRLPRDDGGWAYEIKWDGVRAIAYSQPGELRLESRNLNDVTGQYPELGRLGRALSSHRAVLDGEIVAFASDGRPSFEALQQRMHVSSPAQARRLAKGTPVTYMIFDLLWLDGHSLMGMPYADRRELLAALGLDGASWRAPDHIVGGGAAVLRASAEQGLEGVVAKRLDSIYEPGRRSSSWVKVKNVYRQELVIGGWMPGKGRREQGIGALLVGVYHGERLRYAGRVGTGFSDAELERLAGLLGPRRRARSPFSAQPPQPPRGAVFCEPELVAEVEFREWTHAGSLRAPSYKGLREDKDAREVVREEHPAQDREGSPDASSPGARRERLALAAALELTERRGEGAIANVGGRELGLSNLGKVLYPQKRWTKEDVISYYAAVAEAIVPHLKGRALTVKRWPDGVEGKFFFQKQAPSHRPEWVLTAHVRHESKPIDYVVANDEATLIWLANLAALELHAPLALAEAIERPRTLVFDLDPGEPATIIECCRVALQLQGMFENLGLQSFAKTSGSKGIQLYVPLNREDVTFDETKAFAKAVAELLEEAEGELVVSRMTKARRRGKVLIDWSQNDRRKTTICVYSLRAGALPTVSTPLHWEEVRGALAAGDPTELTFEADEVIARVADHGDLFAPVLSLAQELPSL